MRKLGDAWTEERVERLKALCSEGLTAGEIAAQLGGTSRSAVLGKLHRLGLQCGADAPRAKGRRSRTDTTRDNGIKMRLQRKKTAQNITGNITRPKPSGDVVPLRAAPERATRIDAPQSRKLSLFQLTSRTCRWPEGDPQHSDFGFCGHRTEEGQPYCPYHCDLAYVPVTLKVRRKVA